MGQNKKKFDPTLLDQNGYGTLLAFAGASTGADPLAAVRQLRSFAAEHACDPKDDGAVGNLRRATAASILADLAEQNWALSVEDGSIMVEPPSANPLPGETTIQAKARHRNGLTLASDRQLALPHVQEFLKMMERDRAHDDQVISIKSLIDDGTDLHRRLRSFVDMPVEGRVSALRRLIRPVIQVCDPEARCQFTNLKLLDIWRYFRHTWSLEYNSLPGRTLRLLIRNSARPNWPVMGIAMLASPAANLMVRDRWIGWRVDELIDGLIQNRWKASDVGSELVRAVRDAIADIRTDDLLNDEELEAADRTAFFRLATTAAKAEAMRQRDLKSRGTEGHEDSRLVDIRCLDKENVPDADWHRLSETSLYVKKRAEQLTILLKALSYFGSKDFDTHPGAALMEALVDKQGREAIGVALNEIKKRRLATEVADVSVCGAITPYNHLLGGKLVALLMTSKEARQIYADRYSGQTSEIASQLAGRPIRRSAELKILTTTSLYGIGSSQYNRLKLRASAVPKLWSDIIWEELAPTEGFTITHVSKLTSEYMQRLGVAVYGTRRVNSVFGEGSSPRTRQIREGLNLIGINNDHLLQHSMRRRVYACELFPGARDVVLGFTSVRHGKGPAAATIARGWIERWVSKRIVRPEVLDQIEAAVPSALCTDLHRRAKRAELEPNGGEQERRAKQLDLAI